MITALEYLKTKERICEFYGIHCSKCPLSSDNNETKKSCSIFIEKYPEKAIEIVEIWAKENPVKTYKDVLLEKFPKAQIYDGRPRSCVNSLFGVECPGTFCEDCWGRPYEEVQNDTNK